MATHEVILRVFVAAPKDVADEVLIVSDSIAELNRTLPRMTGIRLEMVNWRTDTFPGVGGDPQEVINDQIGDPDIFVGLLWARFGQPTLRAGSGTEEEFNRAYERHQNSPTSLRLMLYFKKAPVDFDLIDPLQIQAVKAFKDRAGSKGVLYHEFADGLSFASLVRTHLHRQVHEYGKTWGGNIPLQRPDPHSQPPAQEEEGIIDLIERGEEALLTAVESVKRVSTLLEQVGTGIKQKASSVQNLKLLPENQRMRASKQIFNLASVDLTQFAKGLSSEVDLLTESMPCALETLSKVLDYTEFYRGDPKQIENLEDALKALLEGFGSQSTLGELKQSVAELPRITTQFNRAKREAGTALEAYERFTASAAATVAQIQERFKNFPFPN